MSELSTDTKPLSLQERLKQATAKKEPGSIASNVTQNTAVVKTDTAVKEPVIKKASPAWNSSEDFDAPAESKIEKENDTEKQNSEDRKPTRDEMLGGARSMVGTVNMLQRGLFTVWANKRFKNKFTGDEILKIDEIEFKPFSALDEHEKLVQNKWNKLLKNHTKVIEAIPFNSTEIKDLEQALFVYQESTGKALPPWLFGVMAGVNAIGKRVIDIAVDD